MPQASRAERALERDRELGSLQEAIDAAADRSGSLVLIEGPAGAGKTTLLAAARERAEAAGFDVYSARGGELEGEFPFGIARQLFEGRLARAPEDDRQAAFEGSAGLARDALGLGAGVEDVAGDAARDRTLPTLHGLYWLVANLSARGPFLVVVDDVQWADVQSVQWLEYLARRLGDLPVVVVLARRLGDARAAVMLDELGLDPATTLLQPPPLSAGAVEQLLRDLLGQDPGSRFVAACEHATGGNPFLIGELATALREEGIAPVDRNARRVGDLTLVDVSRSVLRRLGRLPPDALELARAAAILGDGTPLQVAAALAGLDERTGAAALDALARANLILPETTIEFVHPLIRQAMYGDMHAAERVLAHRAAAKLLREAGAAPQAVASHLLETEPAGDPGTVEWLSDAAASVFATGTPAAAVPYLERALREPPDDAQLPGLLHRLGRAQLQSGEAHTAVDTLGRAIELLGGRDRAAALHDRAHALGLSGQMQESLAGYAAAAEAAAEFDPETARDLTHTRLSVALLMTSSAESARAELAAIEPPARGDSLGSAALLATLANSAAFANEPRDRVANLAHRALHDFTLADHACERFVPFAQAVWSAIFAGELDLADLHSRRALEAARDRGVPNDFELAASILAVVEWMRGRLWQAEAYGRDALGFASAQGGKVMLPVSVTVLAQPLLERSAVDEAAELLTSHDMWGEKIGWSIVSFPYLVRGRVHMALGRPREALADFRAHGERDRIAGRPHQSRFPWRGAIALALHALGEAPDEQLSLIEEELALARAFGSPREIGGALRVGGLLEGGEGGRDKIADAVEVLRASPFELELCRALADLGALTRRLGARVEARGVLGEALDLADRCGATTIEERVRTELRSAGARPRRTRASGPASLTATERRIAELAATGMTNREIAQAQFVTTKTVETHLASAYRKLDIPGRTGLADALGEPAAA